jgi:hypothetical protein
MLGLRRLSSGMGTRVVLCEVLFGFDFRGNLEHVGEVCDCCIHGDDGQAETDEC